MEPNSPREEEIVAPEDVWPRLDPRLRARVVSLLVQTAYEIVVARSEVVPEEVCDARPTEDGSED